MNVMVRFRAVVMVAVVGCLLGLSQPVGLAPAAAQPAEDAEDTATTAAASGGEEQDEADDEAGDRAEGDDGAASESSGMAVSDNHLNPRNDGMLIKPNEGVAPDDPGDRGGAYQGALFVAVLAGVAGVALLALRDARRHASGSNSGS